MQYVQKLLQPNMMFTKADCPGARRAGSPSTIERSSLVRDAQPLAGKRAADHLRQAVQHMRAEHEADERKPVEQPHRDLALLASCSPQTAITASGRSSLISG